MIIATNKKQFIHLTPMKHFFTFIFFLSLTSCNSIVKDTYQKVSLKNYAEEAMKDSLLGASPIVVISKESVKIYSKMKLNHPVLSNLNRKGLVIIPKNSDVIEEIFDVESKLNGVIVFMEAHELKPDFKKLRYVLNGKEIGKSVSDSIDMKNIKSFVVIQKRNTNQCVAFLNTKY